MVLSDEMVDFVSIHKDDDVNKLVLQSSRYPDIDIQMAASQISARQMAAKKIPLWNENSKVVFPPHLSMEQCSSQQTALYKASIFSGESFVDLTSGLGVDLFFISRNFKFADYVERQELLCDIAANNMKILGADNVEIHNTDAIEFLKQMPHVDLIMIDPARRSRSGGKTVMISDCEPDIIGIEELLVDKGDKVMVKLSPMLDITIALKELKHITSIHVVSVNNECKELLLILERNSANKSVEINCVNISNKTDKFSFTMESESSATFIIAEKMGAYLYEPNASIMKGGGYKTLTKKFEVKKLSVNTHLYTSDELVDSFPGRKFKIEGISSFSGKEVKALLKGIDKANLTIRNFPSSVNDLRKKLKLKEGGDMYLFATTIWDNSKVLIKCSKT